MEMIEKVERLRERADVTYEEAKAALEEAGGDLLDAMVLLERRGKVRGPAQSSYSTEYEEQKDYIRVRDKVEQQKKSAPSFTHTVGRLVKTFFSFIRHTVFIVTKEDSIIFTMPSWVLVLLLFFFWEAIVPVMVIALFFKVNYSFDGAQNVKRANDILGKAGEFAQDVRNEFTANGDASGEEVEDAAYEADVENETEADCDSFPEE
jgi:hypothetical protein